MTTSEETSSKTNIEKSTIYDDVNLTQPFHIPSESRRPTNAGKLDSSSNTIVHHTDDLKKSPKLSMLNSYYAGKLIGITLVTFSLGVVAVVASQLQELVQSVLGRSDESTKQSACMILLPVLGLMAVINVGLAFPAMGWEFATLFSFVHPSSTIVLRNKYLYLCETLFILHALCGLAGLISFVFYGIRLKMEFDGFDSTWGRVVWVVDAVLVLLMIIQWIIFDQFRTHQKHQLGAPNELEHVGSWKLRRWLSALMGKKAKHSSELRANLYAAVKRGKLVEVEAMLAKAHQGLTTDGEREMFFWKMYATPSMILGLFAIRTKNPMHIACQQGDAEMVRTLLKAGLNPNFLDKLGGVDMGIGSIYQWFWRRHNKGKYVLVSPLHVAVSHGHIECINALHEFEANMDILAKTDIFSQELAAPPIFYADSRETMQVLIDYGANHLIVPSFGTAMSTTVLQHNLFLDRLGLARLLEDHGCDYALTPLHALAAAGDVASVQYYLKKGVQPDVLGEYYVGINQRTPLHWAAIMGRTRVVEVLLKHQAKVDFLDIMERTPLHWATRHNQLGVVKALLASGADPLHQDQDGMTAMDIGAHSGLLREDTIRALIAAGHTNLNGLYCGETPLHLALKQGHKEAALALIACGADIYALNQERRRAIDCCHSAELQYSIKKASGSVDVYISYVPAYYSFAQKICKSIEDNFISVNLRPVMDTVPNRDLLKNVSVVLCVLSEGYGQNNLCMSELAVAKQHSVPVVAVNCDCGPLSEELQVYLYTRQIIPFQRSVLNKTINSKSMLAFSLDEEAFAQSLRSLLDGLRDEVELHRLGKRRNPNGQNHTNLTQTVLGGSSRRLLGAFTPPQKKSKTHSVFVSHGDCHSEFVQKLRVYLTEKGVSVRVDSNHNFSDLKERVVAAKDAILQCQLFLVVLSSESILTSLVSDQLAFAEDKGKRIVPICLHSKLDGIDKLNGVFNDRVLVFGDDLGFEHGMDNVVEILEGFEEELLESEGVYVES